ncbi:MAG: hypothetical protein IJL52_01710 [Clostridia bacterium]|nr:hypothetical protein [Clostridia bacterium]
MKHMKKSLAVLLALVMLLCAAPTASASIQPVEGADMTVDWDGVIEAMRRVYLNPAGEVDLTPFNIPDTQANRDYLKKINLSLPEMVQFFADVFRFNSENGIITTGKGGVYRYTDYLEYTEKYDPIVFAIDSILYGIKDNDALSDVDKCLLVHDRLAAWTAYDYDRFLADAEPLVSHFAEGALSLRTCVCDGYAYAYMWMMDYLGIECYRIVDMPSESHAWNEVFLDGEAYFVDVTWDDPVYDVPGRVTHNNFMLSYPTFSASHWSGAGEYDTSPSSTLYENYFSRNAESEIVLIDNTMYFLANGAKLYSRTPDGTITYIRQMENTYSYQAGDTTYTVTPGGRRIIAIGDEVLYLAPRTVQAYNVRTGDLRTVCTPSKSFFPDDNDFLYGIRQQDGVVYITANNSPNFSSDTVKLHTSAFSYCTHPTKVPCRAATHPAGCRTPSNATTICPACRKVFQDTTPDPNNHLFTKTVAGTEPGCYNVGYTEGQQCEACKQYVSGHEELPITHVIEIRDAREATCTNTGYTGTEYCTRCHQRIAVGQHLPSLGHTDPDENGNCTRCGAHIADPAQPEPQQPQPQGSCKWCGKDHGGAFGWLVKLFHNLFASIFGAKY